MCTRTHTWRTQNAKLSRRGWETMGRVLPALVFFGCCCHLVAISSIIVLWLSINCVPLLWTDSRKFWFQPEHEPVRNKEDSRRRHVGCGSVSGQRDTHEDRDWTGSRIQVELEFTPNHLGFVASFLHLVRKKIPQNPFPLLLQILYCCPDAHLFLPDSPNCGRCPDHHHWWANHITAPPNTRHPCS